MVATTSAKLVSIAGYGVVAAIALTQPKTAPVIAVALAAVALRDALSDERNAIPVVPAVLVILAGCGKNPRRHLEPACSAEDFVALRSQRYGVAPSSLLASTKHSGPI